MSKYKKLIQDSALFFMNSFVSKLIGFLLVTLYTRYMSPGEYGIAEIVFDTAGMVVPFFTLGITDGIMRFALDKNNDKSDICDLMLKVLALATVILVLATPIYKSYFDETYYLVFFEVITVTSAVSQVFGSFVKGLENTKGFAVNGIVRVLSMLVANILFLVVFKLGAFGYLLSLVISEIVSVLHYLLFCNVLTHLKLKKTNREMFKALVLYSLPLISNTVCWKIVSLSDRYFLKHYITDEIVGIYTVAHKIPTLITMVSAIFVQAWQITGTREYQKGNFNKTFSEVKDLYIFVMTISIIGLIAVHKPLSILMFDEEYITAYIYTPLLLLSSYINSLVGFNGSVYMVKKNTKYIFVSSLVAAVVNICVNFYTVPRFGAQGAAVSTVFAYTAALAVRLFALYKTKSGIKIKPYNAILFFVACTFTVAEMLETGYMFYIAIVIMAAIVFSKPAYIDVVFGFVRKTLKGVKKNG